MNDLNHLLDQAAGPADLTDAGADLARGRRALATARRRRGAIAVAGLAAVAVVGIGAPRLASHDTTPANTHGAASPQLRMVALQTPLTSGVYTFDKAPDGWAIQGERPDGVTIAPTDGSVSSEPTDFIGKLEVLYDQNPLSGTPFSTCGRTYYVGGDSGYTIISTASRPGEPSGEVLVQYPNDAGWQRSQMVDFLNSVHVGAGAQPGLG